MSQDKQIQDLEAISIQLTTRITYGQKLKLEELARTKANGTDSDMAVYVREALDLIFRKYGINDKNLASVS